MAGTQVSDGLQQIIEIAANLTFRERLRWTKQGERVTATIGDYKLVIVIPQRGVRGFEYDVFLYDVDNHERDKTTLTKPNGTPNDLFHLVERIYQSTRTPQERLEK